GQQYRMKPLGARVVQRLPDEADGWEGIAVAERAGTAHGCTSGRIAWLERLDGVLAMIPQVGHDLVDDAGFISASATPGVAAPHLVKILLPAGQGHRHAHAPFGKISG